MPTLHNKFATQLAAFERRIVPVRHPCTQPTLANHSFVSLDVSSKCLCMLSAYQHLQLPANAAYIVLADRHFIVTPFLSFAFWVA